MSNITLLKDEEFLRELLYKCAVDTRLTAKTLFPDLFTSPFSIIHDKIFDLIDSGHRKIAIAAPRGIGKTTIARTVVSKAILFELASFIVYISNSATSAEMQTENIKRELLSNTLVRKLFGNIKINKDSSIDESFSKLAWVAFGKTFVLPRGSGQQVRGLNWSGKRPQIVVIDDLEHKEDVKNPDLRVKNEDWFFSDLLKTEDKYGDPCIFIYIDTIKHEASLLQKLIDSSDWASITLSICDEDFNSFDPNYMTTEEIKQEYQEHKEKGLTDLFYMERMNIPISLEDAVFKPSSFKYFTEGMNELIVHDVGKEERIKISDLTTIVLVDPAKTVKLQSAESAVITVSVDRKSHRIFVRGVTAAKFEPNQLYDAMFNAVITFKATILGVEVTSLHRFISQPIENEMKVRNIYPLYVEMPARGKKEDRVSKLAPMYQLGYVYHNKANCTPLENQLQWFPRSKRWDVMDAFAYIIYIMDEHAIYFDPPDFEEDSEKDYEELEDLDEDLFLDNWRIA